MSDLQPLVVIENAVIDGLMANPEARAAFSGCFRMLDAVKVDPMCGRCMSLRAEKTAEAYRSVKSCLAAIADDKKRLLKRLLGARQVRITYTSGTRRLKLTF